MLVKKRTGTTLALIVLMLNATAQQKTIDNLKIALTKADEDTTRVMLMDKLAAIYSVSNPAIAMELAREAVLLSQKTDFFKGEAKSLNHEGAVFLITGNYPKALSCYLAALKINEKINHRLELSKNLSNIGMLYAVEGDYRKSVNFFLKAKSALPKHNEQSLAIKLIALGDSYEKLNRLDSANIFTQEAYELSFRIKDIEGIGDATNNLGNIYSKMNNSYLALEYYRKAMPYYKQMDDDDSMCETTLGLARLFKKLGQPDSSLYYAKRSMTAGLHGGFTSRVLTASDFLISYFKGRGKIDSAFYYQELSISAKDSLFSKKK